MDIAWIARRAGVSREVDGKLAEMARMADGMIQEIRRISAQLRPVGLDGLGLAAALEWYAGEFARRIGIPCNVRVELGDVTLERDLSTAAFRICQEALTNVARHAGASRVDVTLRLDADHLRLEVVDDGVGLPQSELADSPCWPARPRAARPSEVLPCETQSVSDRRQDAVRTSQQGGVGAGTTPCFECFYFEESECSGCRSSHQGLCGNAVPFV